MYIWSHLCLVVSLSPFIFSLLLPLFSLISSALSASLLLGSFFPPQLFIAGLLFLCLLSCFPHLAHGHPSHPISFSLLFPSFPISSSVPSIPSLLSSPGLNDLEMLLSFIWIWSGLDAHSKETFTEDCGQRMLCLQHFLWQVENSQSSDW